MEIFVNVIGQKLYITTDTRPIVEGSRQFVKFVYNLPEEWEGLYPFAQFIQSGNAYNIYLDENNSVFLPTEIKAGKCIMLLYGTDGTVRATTNGLVLTIDSNMLVANADSIEITQSLYEQMIEHVDQYQDIIDDNTEAIGTLSGLTTTAKTDLVVAINEVNANVGDLGELTTTDTSSAVGAINEINSAINDMGNIVGISYTVVATF